LNSTEVRKDTKVRRKEFAQSLSSNEKEPEFTREGVDKDYYQKGRKRKRRKRTCQKVQSGSKNLRNEKEKKSHLI